jgi:hypothetical protein
MLDTPSATLARKSPLILNVLLWAAQAFVGVSFAVIAWIKLSKPIAELAAMWPWTGEFPEAMVRGLGVIDLGGGLGIVLPTLTRIRPNLAVTAAACCAALQVCAMIFHISRGEAEATPVNVVFLSLSLFIFWGRRKYAVAARG